MRILSARFSRKVGRHCLVTNIESSELVVGAVKLVVVRCHCWEGAACFIDFGHCVCVILSLCALKVGVYVFSIKLNQALVLVGKDSLVL